MTGLQATKWDGSNVTWKNTPESSTQDNGGALADEVAAIETEPLGVEGVPRPRAARRADIQSISLGA